MDRGESPTELWHGPEGSKPPGLTHPRNLLNSKGDVDTAHLRQVLWSLNGVSCALVKDQEFWRNYWLVTADLLFFSRRKFNRERILEWAHSSSEFNGFPCWSDLSGSEEKTGLLPPRKHRLLEAITLLWFNSLLANTHGASVCTQALTPVPAWGRETPSSTPWVNTFHPVQSWSESLNKGKCTLPGIRFLNDNNPNPIKHPHCKLRMIQGQVSSLTAKASYMGRCGEGKKRLWGRRNRKHDEHDSVSPSLEILLFYHFISRWRTNISYGQEEAHQLTIKWFW